MISIDLTDKEKKFLESEIRKRVAKLVFDTHAEIVRATPVDTGRLRESIIVEETPDKNFIIGTNLEYAEYVEVGTKPHKIVPKNKQALYWKGADHPVKSVNHPGTTGRGMFQRGITYVENNFWKYFN